MFGQLSNRDSLRDLIVTLDAHRNKCFYLGMGKNASKSSLSRANQDRNYHIFEEFAYYMIEQAKQNQVTDICHLEGSVYAFDSTTINLCLPVFCEQDFVRQKAKLYTV